MTPDIVLGVVTVIMALLGAAVSLHPPDKVCGKVCYATAFAVLGAIAIVSVIKQSKETAIANQNLTNAIATLGGSTKEISRVTNLNAALQQKLLDQSGKISNLAEDNFKTITGAGSFPYVAPQPTLYPNPVPLFAWDHGKYMLAGVTMTIRRADDFAFYHSPVDIGILHRGWGKPLPVEILPKPDPQTGEDVFLIDMYTQTDFFTQILHFRRSTDGKYWAYKYWVDENKFGERPIDKPLPKAPPTPKTGSVSFPVYDRSTWSDEVADGNKK